MRRALKWTGIGCGGLLALVVIVIIIGVIASGGVATTLETCEELAPEIIKLSEERENPFAGRILKFYEIEELEATGEYILRCRARATRSRGGDADVIFHMTEDEDGDRFIGMESQ